MTASAVLARITAAAAIVIIVPDPGQYLDRPPGIVVGMLAHGTCVPIGHRWALTANHVGVKAGDTVRVGDQVFTIAKVVKHPDAPGVDLKVIEIAGPPWFAAWATPERDPSAVAAGTPVMIGGTGKTNDVASGGGEGGGGGGECVAWDGRAERWAENIVGGHAGAWTWTRYDPARPHCGQAAVYDSGSPLLERDGSAWLLIGVATSASTATGPTCPGHTAYYRDVDPAWLAPYADPPCRGDVNGDGVVDVADEGLLRAGFGKTGLAPFTGGDLDGDGDVDVFDFSILAGDFGCRASPRGQW